MSKGADQPHWDYQHIRERLEQEGFRCGAEPPPIAWFGDDPSMAHELGALVRAGHKRATAGLLWKWEADGKAIPCAGDRQVIIDWQGEPLAVIEMTEVRVLPFEQVGEEFAREEGEGDLSLRHWRDVHWRFFARECARIDRAPHLKMPVICMRFRILHPRPP